MAEEVTVVDVLLRYLDGEGVEYVFGVPGGPLSAFFEALEANGKIRFVLAKHEEGAVFMANSHARVQRGLAVAVVTSGPGVTNTVSGVAGAFMDSLPVLVLSAQVSTRAFGKGAMQESTAFGVDIVSMLEPITKLSALMGTAERAPALIELALREALTGRRGPVHLSLPADVAKQKVPGTRPAPMSYRPLFPPSPHPQCIADAARRLLAAEHPSILAGHGVALANAEGELRELAELLSIPIATTPKGKGCFPETHPLALGVFGLGGHDPTYEFFLSDDVLLVAGSSLNEFATSAWDSRLLPSSALIQLDIDAARIGQNYPVDVALVGDARTGLRALIDEISRLLGGKGRAPIDRGIPKPLPLENLDAHRQAGSSAMQPQDLMRELRDGLPDDALLFVDSGNCVMWAAHYFEIRTVGTYFADLGLACMGSSVAGVIGGKLAAPARVAVCITGDAAFAMHGMEVHTAVELELPVIWVVLNNSGHGMVLHGEKMRLGRELEYPKFQVPIDSATLARALGARGVRVETSEAARAAITEAMAATGPTVIDAIIDGSIPPPTLARRVRALAQFFGAKVPDADTGRYAPGS
jgi:acetolactate synthase-1/2/3 large subunit